jgi:hypothetical protein
MDVGLIKSRARLAKVSAGPKGELNILKLNKTIANAGSYKVEKE